MENTNNKTINTTFDNQELTTKLRNEILKFHRDFNVFEDWNDCKNNNPQLKEFFEETEKQAKKELIDAKDIAKILDNNLSTYLAIPKLDELIIEYFGITSIYNIKIENENGKIYQCMSVDNVGIFRAVLMINIIAIMYHISDVSLPIGLKIIFERKEFIDIIGPIIKQFLPKIIKNIDEINFSTKI